MRKIQTLTTVIIVCACLTGAARFMAGNAVPFERGFTGKTLRVDYYHTGTATKEIFSLDRLRIEGDWPDSPNWLLDETNLGKYRVEVTELATHRLLYSRGFASIYGEWETTGEAKKETARTFEEAVRVPEPRRPVQVKILKRDGDSGFREAWSLVIDPSSRFVDRAPVAHRTVRALLRNGEPARKVDLLILGDGFTAGEMDAYRDAAERVMDALFQEEPFRSRKDDFNVWMIETPAGLSGISRPRAGVFRGPGPPGAPRYNSFRF